MAYEQDEQPKLPQKTVDLLHEVYNRTPTVPVELTQYYATRAGCSGEPDDLLVKLLSIAGERFVSTVIHDAVQIAKRRAQPGAAVARRQGAAQSGKDKQQQRFVLTTEDLTEALKEYGINARSPPYHVNQPPK